MTTASHKIKVIYYIGKGEGLGTKASQVLMRVGDWGEGGGVGNLQKPRSVNSQLKHYN